MAASLSTYAVHRSAVVAQALHHRLGATPGFTSSGWATSASDALFGIEQYPEVWVVDERLPRSGAAVLCDHARREGCEAHVVVLADLTQSEHVIPLVERGAKGVVDVHSSWPLFVKAVRTVGTGVTSLPAKLESDLLRSMLLARSKDDMVIRSLLRLTDRERQVLLLLCRGVSRAEVSHELHISAHTARTHVQRVIDKLGVHSQREVVALGMSHRLVERFEAR
jgi:DNA-binding NarL/FixJ family response regulator